MAAPKIALIELMGYNAHRLENAKLEDNPYSGGVGWAHARKLAWARGWWQAERMLPRYEIGETRLVIASHDRTLAVDEELALEECDRGQ